MLAQVRSKSLADVKTSARLESTSEVLRAHLNYGCSCVSDNPCSTVTLEHGLLSSV